MWMTPYHSGWMLRIFTTDATNCEVTYLDSILLLFEVSTEPLNLQITDLDLSVCVSLDIRGGTLMLTFVYINLQSESLDLNHQLSVYIDYLWKLVEDWGRYFM